MWAITEPPRPQARPVLTRAGIALDFGFKNWTPIRAAFRSGIWAPVMNLP